MSFIGTMIEGLVAILLMLTIGYCWLLNRRLKLLKSDEQSLRATISELVTATEIAERAIGGLKLTIAECEAGLGARLASAERFTADLDRGILAARDFLGRLPQSAGTAAGAKAPPVPAAPIVPTVAPAPPSNAQAVAAAAQAFAERVRKVHGLAA
jgi:uncharacterized protein DUF6468